MMKHHSSRPSYLYRPWRRITWWNFVETSCRGAKHRKLGMSTSEGPLSCFCCGHANWVINLVREWFLIVNNDSKEGAWIILSQRWHTAKLNVALFCGREWKNCTLNMVLLMRYILLPLKNLNLVNNAPNWTSHFCTGMTNYLRIARLAKPFRTLSYLIFDPKEVLRPSIAGVNSIT